MRLVRTRDFTVYINYSLFIVGNGGSGFCAYYSLIMYAWKYSLFGLFAKYLQGNKHSATGSWWVSSRFRDATQSIFGKFFIYLNKFFGNNDSKFLDKIQKLRSQWHRTSSEKGKALIEGYAWFFPTTRVKTIFSSSNKSAPKLYQKKQGDSGIFWSDHCMFPHKNNFLKIKVLIFWGGHKNLKKHPYLFWHN